MGWTWDEQCVFLYNRLKGRNELTVDVDVDADVHLEYRRNTSAFDILAMSGLIHCHKDRISNKHFILTTEKLLVHILQRLFGFQENPAPLETPSPPKKSTALGGITTLGELSAPSPAQGMEGIINLADVKEILSNSLDEYLAQRKEDMQSAQPNKEKVIEILVGFLEKKELFHLIYLKDKQQGTVKAVLFPSLLHPAAEQEEIPETVQGIGKGEGNLVLEFHFNLGVKANEKLVDFVFPRLLVRLWRLVVGVGACRSNSFVVMGNSPSGPSAELNLLSITRRSGIIAVRSVGKCLETLIQVHRALHSLVLHFERMLNTSEVHTSSPAELWTVLFRCPNKNCENKFKNSRLTKILTSTICLMNCLKSGNASADQPHSPEHRS